MTVKTYTLSNGGSHQRPDVQRTDLEEEIHRIREPAVDKVPKKLLQINRMFCNDPIPVISRDQEL